MNRWNLITVEPAIMNGQSCVRGMRLTVRRVLELLTIYPDKNDLFREFPELEPEDVQQCLEFAACNLDVETFDLNVA
ncbi:MAG: DUF433 domain-containing protein [Candidatus Competibacteraceae bacterium]|jgi:uncharacterized protein (DUF433 family)|nr:DUF433 domain-containing protein [Candidatus Competibacteraceae bacterium]MBK7983406.1 DUF433 domain-containing protein [Candidatus Competibacteraceae bacterium]MBK8898048.1 DUF433 domain-containing protein [Candidatus Competibacteraceae bacterium]MBK8961856.1 DUF433 domain-containing protein [Candidatus Competibacteraceae bacterium]MBK9951071.1 DUF433 domain-containing protein [Candidatus Competibacteraceae bacterium]